LLCCFRSASSVTERLAGSTYLFLCGSIWRTPLLWTLGLATALLQSVLLLLVWSRAEANMFYEFYAHGLVRINSTSLYDDYNATDLLDALRHESMYRFPSVEAWKQLGRTGAPGEGIAAAGAAGGASFSPQVDALAGIERYNVMIRWSEHHAYLPQFLTHPDLQLDYALLFSLIMLFVWVSKDAIDALWCIAGGFVLSGFFIALNVFLALGTGWDQMYVKFLPIFVWDTPANVIGVSPISMILDSVAVMLILDLDDKAYGLIKSAFSVAVHKFEKSLDELEMFYDGHYEIDHEVHSV